MQIYGTPQVHGPQPIAGPHANRPAQTTSSVSGFQAGGDEVQISDTAQLVDLAKQLPDIRQDRVNQIRTAIANGSYDSNEKLGIALDRLLDEIG